MHVETGVQSKQQFGKVFLELHESATEEEARRGREYVSKLLDLLRFNFFAFFINSVGFLFSIFFVDTVVLTNFFLPFRIANYDSIVNYYGTSYLFVASFRYSTCDFFEWDDVVLERKKQETQWMRQQKNINYKGGQFPAHANTSSNGGVSSKLPSTSPSMPTTTGNLTNANQRQGGSQFMVATDKYSSQVPSVSQFVNAPCANSKEAQQQQFSTASGSSSTKSAAKPSFTFPARSNVSKNPFFESQFQNSNLSSIGVMQQQSQFSSSVGTFMPNHRPLTTTQFVGGSTSLGKSQPFVIPSSSSEKAPQIAIKEFSSNMSQNAQQRPLPPTQVPPAPAFHLAQQQQQKRPTLTCQFTTIATGQKQQQQQPTSNIISCQFTNNISRQIKIKFIL